MPRCESITLKNHQQSSLKETHLIIIAGVGGQLLSTFLEALLPLNAQFNIEFLICPVHHNFLVRETLIKHKLKLINELLIFEQGRYYEILHVSSRAELPIVNVGSMMWEGDLPMHQLYLQQTIAHYQRMLKNKGAEVEKIIKAYQAL